MSVNPGSSRAGITARQSEASHRTRMQARSGQARDPRDRNRLRAPARVDAPGWHERPERVPRCGVDGRRSHASRCVARPLSMPAPALVREGRLVVQRIFPMVSARAPLRSSSRKRRRSPRLRHTRPDDAGVCAAALAGRSRPAGRRRQGRQRDDRSKEESQSMRAREQLDRMEAGAQAHRERRVPARVPFSREPGKRVLNHPGPVGGHRAFDGHTCFERTAEAVPLRRG